MDHVPKWIGHATIADMPALKPKGVLGLVLHPHSDPTAVAETADVAEGDSLVTDSDVTSAGAGGGATEGLPMGAAEAQPPSAAET